MLQNAIAAMALVVALTISAPAARAFDETKYPDWSWPMESCARRRPAAL